MFYMKNLRAGFLACLFFAAVSALLPACKGDGDSQSAPGAASGGNRVLEKEAFASAIKRGNAMLIDVRSPAEFEQGHIDKAININFFDPEFKHKILELKRTKEYYLYGKNEVTSYRTMEFMKSNDFPEVYILKGGWESWNTATDEQE